MSLKQLHKIEVEVGTEVMRLSSQTILLVDHTKFDKKHAYKFSDWSSFESIITDVKPNPEYLTLAENVRTEILF
ncbi:hypothetical protein IGI37_001390 [Enterococcus sp. AZ194]|uniref:hypothetical protein n=1 Tax=Enterococcus sp. AZ194 TaxID=2774629 RepID=UPI003F22A642